MSRPFLTLHTFAVNAYYPVALIQETDFILSSVFMSIIAFLVCTITCVAESNPKQSNESVWIQFENTSGYSSDAIVFLTGLVNPNFIYSGLDGAIHLAEECTNATTSIPRALVSTVVIGFATALGFGIAMCYSYNDFDAVLAASYVLHLFQKRSLPSAPLSFTPCSCTNCLSSVNSFPILEIFYQATSSKAIATFFTVVLAVIILFAITGAQQTASRLTWSFARDNALVGSSYLSRLHPRWDVPICALLANCGCVFLLGCINLGSTSAFNALVATGLILQQLSFAFPAALLLYHRAAGTLETIMPAAKIQFKLPFGVGPLVNALTVVLGLLSLIFYDIPYVLPATASNMSKSFEHPCSYHELSWLLILMIGLTDYAPAVIGIMGVLALINWVVHASKRYKGPRLDGHH